MKILVSSPAFNQPNLDTMRGYLEKFFEEVIYNPYGRTLKEDELLELWNDVDCIIAGIEIYTEKTLKQAPRNLKIISRFGTGYENIDIRAAGKLGIAVANTPGVNATAVAELTLGLMIAVARKIPQLDKKARQGEWERFIGIGLSNKTLGIIGLGSIGREVAIRAKGFNMNIMAFDPYIDEKFVQCHNIRVSSLEEIFEKADVITLHLPATEQTEKMINRETIRKMKRNAILINTARGKLIDEKALYDALINKEIAGAGLDVFEQEPPKNSPLLKLNNVVITPHIGGHTQEACELMAKTAIENVVSYLKNNQCSFIVNKRYLE